MNYHRQELGLDFAKMAIALALHDNRLENAITFARRQWGPAATATMGLSELATKANEISGADGSSGWGSALASAGAAGDDFIAYARPLSIRGKLQGIRQVPPRLPFATQTQGSTGYFAGAGLAKPLSSMAFVRSTIVPTTISALAVFSMELLRDASHYSVAGVRDDLAGAAVEVWDRAFLSDLAASGGTPAGIGFGSVNIASTNNLADDAENAIDSFKGALSSASWITSPRLAASIGLRTGSGGAANDVGAKGGIFCGLPLLTSETITHDSDGTDLLLVDGAGIAIASNGASVRSTGSAMVEMNSAPTGDVVTPVGATVTRVSLFQEDSVAIVASIFENWLACRPGGVVRISGANYL